jgi:hypothetical protein
MPIIRRRNLFAHAVSNPVRVNLASIARSFLPATGERTLTERPMGGCPLQGRRIRRCLPPSDNRQKPAGDEADLGGVRQFLPAVLEMRPQSGGPAFDAQRVAS